MEAVNEDGVRRMRQNAEFESLYRAPEILVDMKHFRIKGVVDLQRIPVDLL